MVIDWKENADIEIERALYERAKGYSHEETVIKAVSGGRDEPGYIDERKVTKHYPPDTRAIMYWLNNRKGKYWKEKQEVHHTGVENMSNEQIKAEAERILREREKK